MHERGPNRRLRPRRRCPADTEMSVAEIAGVLGYGDSTACIRAFRQWSGLPPAAWWQRHGWGAVR
jgi:AraC-like DNA-binding protein